MDQATIPQRHPPTAATTQRSAPHAEGERGADGDGSQR
jgi:hypothetical protein